MFKKSVEPIDVIPLSWSKKYYSPFLVGSQNRKYAISLCSELKYQSRSSNVQALSILLGPKVIYIFPNSCFCFVTQMNAVSLRYCHTKFKVFVCFVFLRCSFEQCLNQVETFPLAVIQSVQSLYPYMRCNDYSLHLELTSSTM